jgi:hypothetical protein
LAIAAASSGALNAPEAMSSGEKYTPRNLIRLMQDFYTIGATVTPFILQRRRSFGPRTIVLR